MRTTRFLNLAGMALIGIAACFFALRTHLYAQQRPPVTIDADDIGGVVSSSTGPEAGVWVIAETTELPTHYIKEVVTDDQGRYLIPDPSSQVQRLRALPTHEGVLGEAQEAGEVVNAPQVIQLYRRTVNFAKRVSLRLGLLSLAQSPTDPASEVWNGWTVLLTLPCYCLSKTIVA